MSANGCFCHVLRVDILAKNTSGRVVRCMSVFFEPLGRFPDFFGTDDSHVAWNVQHRFDHRRLHLFLWLEQLVSLHQNRIDSFHTHHLVDDKVLRVGVFAADFFFLLPFGSEIVQRVIGSDLVKISFGHPILELQLETHFGLVLHLRLLAKIHQQETH